MHILSVAPYPDKSLGGLRVFGGAWNHTCTRAHDDIVPAVKSALERGTQNIIFTGHSLGGGCAILARFFMQTAAHGLSIPASTRMRAVTFGAPIVFALRNSNVDATAPASRATLPEEVSQVLVGMEKVMRVCVFARAHARERESGLNVPGSVFLYSWVFPSPSLTEHTHSHTHTHTPHSSLQLIYVTLSTHTIHEHTPKLCQEIHFHTIHYLYTPEPFFVLYRMWSRL